MSQAPQPMSSEPGCTAQWTQDEAIAFEAARECITDLMAIRTGQIEEEAQRSTPDAAHIEVLRADRLRLHHERASLGVADHATVARVRSEYGALVRAWRAGCSATAPHGT